MKSYPQAIAHIDADAFFASVELLSRPELRGKPVMVAGVVSDRGVVTAATYEARKFGIHAGIPVFQARKLCPHGIFLPAHFERYQEISLRIFGLLSDFSPTVEQTSIDEGYLDLTGLRHLFRTSYAGIARLMQKRIKETLKVTISVGVAPSKLLAKMASEFRKPEGLTLVSMKTREQFLDQCSCHDIPGVGPNTQALLQKFGLNTALEIAKMPEGVIHDLLGKRGEEIWKELNGESVNLVRPYTELPQSISKSQTFLEFTSDRKVIYAFGIDLLIQATGKMRRLDLWARRLLVFLRTKQFQVFKNKEKLPTFHQDDSIFMRYFKDLFEKIYVPGVVYRSVGVCLSDFAWQTGTQLSLFGEEEDDSELMRAIDRLNQRYGSGTVTRASTLFHDQNIHEVWMGSSFERSPP